jgi:hypothetical protein
LSWNLAVDLVKTLFGENAFLLSSLSIGINNRLLYRSHLRLRVVVRGEMPWDSRPPKQRRRFSSVVCLKAIISGAGHDGMADSN